MFCKEYLKDFNATRSAIAAGYSKKTAKSQGQRLLTNVDVAEYLKYQITKRADKVDLSVEMVLKDLMELKSRCMQQVPVLDKDGNETGEWKFEHTGATKSLELLGKHLAMFTDKIEDTTKYNKYSGLTDAKLEEEIKKIINESKSN